MLRLAIDHYRGSVEHYYHFLLGFYLPLVRYLSHDHAARAQLLVLRSCGPMNRIVRELQLHRLFLLPPRLHRLLSAVVPTVSITGYDCYAQDWGHVPSPVAGTREAAAAVRLWLSMDVARHRDAIERSWSEHPRILLIERGSPDPFYLSRRAERPGSGTSRRSLENHRELAQSLPTCRNLLLEGRALAEQIAWFELADVVIAQHGAALANVVWMRPATRVIEITNRSEEMFARLARGFDVAYARVPQDGEHSPVDVESVRGLIPVD